MAEAAQAKFFAAHPEETLGVDEIRFRAFVQIVVMDQNGLAQFAERPVAKRPFAAIAVFRRDIAVDIQPAIGR